MPETAAGGTEELSEAELLQAARRGDSTVFGAVLDRHLVALFARALACLESLRRPRTQSKRRS